MKQSSNKFRHLVWPLVSLALLLLFNAIFTDNFFKIEIKKTDTPLISAPSSSAAQVSATTAAQIDEAMKAVKASMDQSVPAIKSAQDADDATAAAAAAKQKVKEFKQIVVAATPTGSTTIKTDGLAAGSEKTITLEEAKQNLEAAEKAAEEAEKVAKAAKAEAVKQTAEAAQAAKAAAEQAEQAAQIAKTAAMQARMAEKTAKDNSKDGISLFGYYLYGTPIDILNQGAKVMVLAIGMTLVIATGGIDISVGAVMAIAGAIAALLISLIDPSGSAFAPAYYAIIPIIVALLLSMAAGFWNGMLVAGFGIQPMVATLVLMVAGRGVAQLITDGQIITFDNPGLVFLCNGHALFLPFSVWIVVAMYVLAGLFTRKTAFGLFIESVGNNERASRYTGIEARRIKWLAYVICGFCAGVAGLLAASNIKCADSNNAGLYLELDAILATVIGGTSMAGGRFFLSGSLVGAILIQTLTTTMYMKNVSPAIVQVPKAMVVIIVCLLQSPVFRAKVLSIFVSKAAKGGVQ